MSLAKKILGIGSAVILSGSMIYHMTSELSMDLSFRNANTVEYRENIGSHQDDFRLKFLMIHDTNHDGTPDYVQVKTGACSGVFGARPSVFTSQIRKPTEKEIQYFQSQK